MGRPRNKDRKAVRDLTMTIRMNRYDLDGLDEIVEFHSARSFVPVCRTQVVIHILEQYIKAFRKRSARKAGKTDP